MSFSSVILKNRNTWKDEVREVLLGENDTTSLPDSMLERGSVGGAAERRIKARVGNYADLTGDEKEHLVDAAIMMVAAIMVTSIPDIIKEKFEGSQTEYQKINVAKKVQYFLDQAEQYIGYITTNTTAIPEKISVKAGARDPALFEDI